MQFKERRFACANGHTAKLLRWDTDPDPDCPTCGAPTEREFTLTGKAPCVVGDECDVTVEHGICHADGTPKRYTSKADMRAAAKALGWTNVVEHKPMPGSDRSPHTTRWV
jgi:hypothetical protein